MILQRFVNSRLQWTNKPIYKFVAVLFKNFDTIVIAMLFKVSTFYDASMIFYMNGG